MALLARATPAVESSEPHFPGPTVAVPSSAEAEASSLAEEPFPLAEAVLRLAPADNSDYHVEEAVTSRVLLVAALLVVP